MPSYRQGDKTMKKLSKKQNYKFNLTVLKILLVPLIGSLLIIIFAIVEIGLYTSGGK